MDVDVHLRDGQGEVQHAGREAALHELVAVGLLERGGQELRFDIAAVDEKVLIVAVAAGGRRAGNKAGDGMLLPPAADREHIRRRLAAEDAVHGAFELPVAGRG